MKFYKFHKTDIYVRLEKVLGRYLMIKGGLEMCRKRGIDTSKLIISLNKCEKHRIEVNHLIIMLIAKKYGYEKKEGKWY
jgi:hypothetical protein